MSRFTRLLASGAVTTALAAGLTAGGLAASPAQAAAPVSTTYTCSLLGVPFDVPATFAIAGLPAELPIGLPTPELPATGTLTLPNNVVTQLFGLVSGTLQAVTSTALAPVGAGAVGVQLQSAVTTVGIGVGNVLALSGTLPSFIPDQTGTQSIALPTTIDVGILSGLLAPLGVVKCALKGGSGATTTFATYTVTKSASTLNARTTKVEKGKKPKVSVTVTVATPGTTTLGSVAASETKQSLGTQPLYGGTATFVLKGLKKGLHTLRFAYSGSNFAGPSEQTFTFTFPKAKKHVTKRPGKKHHR